MSLFSASERVFFPQFYRLRFFFSGLLKLFFQPPNIFPISSSTFLKEDSLLFKLDQDTKTVYVLKCDIRKFFANIDHKILLDILRKQIDDENTVRLLDEVIKSFYTKNMPGKGLPLGNLTSQLFVNVYMNEFDQFVKRDLKVKYYIRYADDFVIFDSNKNYLEKLLPKISDSLEKNLNLSLNSNKVSIETLASGIDFLG